MLRTFIALIWTAAIFLGLYLPHLKTTDTLDIFTWGDFFVDEVIEDFEKQNNVKVKLHYFSSNEECLVKLKASKYDLITPSDYAVKIMIKQDLLQPLDHSKLQIPKLSPFVEGHPFDPDQTYSVPYQWEIYGVGYDKEYFSGQDLPQDFSPIFHPKGSYKIAMTPDPVEAINYAAHYLHGDKEHLTPAEITSIKQLLRNQRPHIEAYENYRDKYLLSTKNCQIALIGSSFVIEILDGAPHLDFYIPKDASFITIENFVIPKTSKKADLAHKFMNHCLTPENSAKNLQAYSLYPTVEAAIPLLDKDPLYFRIYDETAKRKEFQFFRYVIPEDQIRDIWTATKS